jgi:pre-mRNA-splicing factor CWC22
MSGQGVIESEINRNDITRKLAELKAEAGTTNPLVAYETPAFKDPAYQKIQWKLLKREINKHIYSLDTHNIQSSIVELFQLNLLRGRGIFVRTIMKSQMEEPRFTPLFASLIAVINSKIPEVGELICKRVILQFRKNYIRNKKRVTYSSSMFIGHLVNQKVLSEVVILQMLQLLLEKPSEDSIALVCEILKIVGAFLNERSKVASNMVFNRLSDILHEGVSQKSQSLIEHVLAIRKEKFRKYASVVKELDLVEEEDQETHIIELEEKIEALDELNVFTYDENYEENEAEYEEIRQEIIGETDKQEIKEPEAVEEIKVEITDLTASELLEYQKTIYLTVMSSMSSDEAVHKLLRINFGKTKQDKQKNSEILADMLVKCCSQEKTYSKYFGVIGEKLCQKNNYWHEIFIQLFKRYYGIISQFETNALRNIGKFFGHLFASDKLSIEKSWNEIRLTEEETTSAGRILLKFIFQEMIEELGVKEVKERLIDDDYVKPHINGIFPVLNVTWRDADDIRFSINFFTAVGLGVLTEEMREVLRDLPAPETRGRSRSRDSKSRSRSFSRSRSGSYSRSRSGSYSRSRSGSYSRSPSISRDRGRNRSRSPVRNKPSRSVSYSRSRSRSRSYSRSRSRSRSYSRSRSPVKTAQRP